MHLLDNLTLQRRISLLVLGGLAIGLGLFSWLGVQSVDESVQRTLDERLTMARMLANHLDENLTHALAQLQGAADAGEGMPADDWFTPAANDLLLTFERSGVPALRVILLNSEGQILKVQPAGPTTADNLDDTGLLTTLQTGAPAVSPSVSSPWTERPVVFIGTPVIGRDGNIAGILAVSIDVGLWSTGSLGAAVTLGETGYTEVVDSNGLVLARTKPGSPAEASEKSDHPDRFAELITQGKATVRTCHRCHETAGNAERVPELRDVLAFAPLSTASWGVVIRQSEEEALEPTSQLKDRLLLIGLLVIAISLLLVWLVMQGVVKPVKMLTAAAQRVAGGDLKAAMPVARQDEIGQLSGAFYTMTKELARSRDELVLRNRQLKTYASYVIGAQEEERQRIARELHDETMQLLVLLCRRLDNIQESAEPLTSSLSEQLLDARETAEQVVKELRDFTKGLRPPILDDLGMVTSVRRLLADLEERSGISGGLEVIGRERRLPSDLELGMFRIAQEALHNVERHSKTKRVDVTVTFAADQTILEVADSGTGFSAARVLSTLDATGHLGLSSMRERAELLGGSLDVRSVPGSGTTITATVPLRTTSGSPGSQIGHLAP